MILNASQRGGAQQLAVHLLNDENEHIEVHSLRGFASSDLKGAFVEAHAIAKGTKCSQFLFSLSLSPPPDAAVSTQAFEDAIDRVEETLSLIGQPRAIVFHEKEGRRHAHAVWSRINAETMTAVPLPFFKLKLREISRGLYLEHGWTMPKGLADSKLRDPTNFTLADWQQAKRAERDPRDIKRALQDAWALSDSKASYIAALAERGFKLARGDRRGFVALDHEGEVYAIARWTGIKTKDVRAKLGPEKDLPALNEARQAFAAELIPRLEQFREEAKARRDRDLSLYDEQRQALTDKHKAERNALAQKHAKRWKEEQAARQRRYRRGLFGLWDRLTGKHSAIAAQNIEETKAAVERDTMQRDALIKSQLTDRRKLQVQKAQALKRYRSQDRDISCALAKVMTRDQSTAASLEQLSQDALRHQRRRTQYKEDLGI
ncbi:MAG: relaxase [Pseudomonadota bacterium]